MGGIDLKKMHSYLLKLLIVIFVLTGFLTGCSSGDKTNFNVSNTDPFNISRDKFNRAGFEYHHLFAQEYFESAIDESNKITLKLRNYEHVWWLHGYSDFNNDWEKVEKNVPFILKLFGGSSNQLSKDGKISNYALRNGALIAGSRVISYQWVVYDYNKKVITKPGFLFATHFDGVSNLLYNVSYILSIPAKAIHFTIMCIKSIPEYGFGDSLRMFVWMLLQQVIGLISSIVMVFVGTIIGLLCHPLQTLGNLTVSFSNPLMNNLLVTLIDLIKAIFLPVIHIIFW